MNADSVARNEKVASSLAAIEQIKQEYQAVQGNLDSNNHLIQQQQSEIARLKNDIYDRMASIEDRLTIYDIQITKAVAKVLPQAANETESYQKGLDLVKNSDFLSAVGAFKAFVKAYPKSELADKAQYWIGECYFALKDYPKSIKEFQVLIDKYAKSDKTPTAMLKQGYAFAELGLVDDAKMFLNKVVKDYPSSDEAIRAKEKIERLNQKTIAPTTPTQGGGPTTETKKPPVTDATSNIPLAPGVKQQPSVIDDTAPEKTTRESIVKDK